MSDYTPQLLTGEDGVSRCWWCGEHADYIAYHDDEWGRPTADDNRLYEKLCLEGFQAGLSWLTILRKRENFRRAFKDFDFEKVARFRSSSVERLLKDAGIVVRLNRPSTTRSERWNWSTSLDRWPRSSGSSNRTLIRRSTVEFLRRPNRSC